MLLVSYICATNPWQSVFAKKVQQVSILVVLQSFSSVTAYKSAVYSRKFVEPEMSFVGLHFVHFANCDDYRHLLLSHSLSGCQKCQIL